MLLNVSLNTFLIIIFDNVTGRGQNLLLAYVSALCRPPPGMLANAFNNDSFVNTIIYGLRSLNRRERK